MQQRSDKPLKILIVEDNPAHCETYRNMILLDSAQHHVTCLSRAADFLETPARAEHYDCAILDVRLPDMSGIALSQRLAQYCPELPVIFITAYSNEDEALQTLLDGAEDYLPKGEYNQKLFMRSIKYAIERKRHKVEQLRMAEELRLQKEINQSQKDFVSMISHEFRTPLAIISSSVQFIERQDNTGATPKTLEHLEKISRAVKRLGALVENTLYYSKLEEGALAFRPERICLRSLIDEAIEGFRQLYPDKQFEVTYASSGEGFEGDKEMLHHALLNLLSNAVKFSDRLSDYISIRLSQGTEIHPLLLEITDYGRGMTPEALARVGERFYRAANSYGVSGNGIGLHITQKLIELHKGRFTLVSEEGKGTTAQIWLPLPQPKNA